MTTKWTTADVEAVNAAIRDLATGERVVTVRYSDGTETSYGQANLSELRTLRTEMSAEARSTAGTPRRVHLSLRSGY